MVTDISVLLVDWYTIHFTGVNSELTNWISIITIIPLGIAPIWYFWKKQRDEKSERKRASENLYTELNDTLDALDETKYDDLKKVKSENNEFYFMNRALNHDFYDSLIFSGKINFLRSELQQPIQDIFQRIKDHNFYIRKIRGIEDNASISEDITVKTLRYYKILSEDEIKLMKDIPDMQEKLKNEFKIKSSSVISS